MTHHELEAKFECTPAEAERLLALTDLAGFRLDAEHERTQDDVYFDTLDRTLRANSASLRLRRIGAGTLLATYKGPREALDAGGGAQIVKRPEIEHPVQIPAGAHLNDDLPPSLLTGTPALRQAEATLGPLVLVPVARLETRRRVRRFARDSSPVLELAFDQSTGIRLGDGRRVEFIEIELELLSGDVQILQAAISALQAACPGLQTSRKTKLGRTLD